MVNGGRVVTWVGNAGRLAYRPLCLPINGDLPASPAPGYRITLEMYGGAGLGANAGGVRCGNSNDYQIKGIGSTILAGPSTDKWHRHGALSLQDAVREVIMGELFHVASPHGAVRGLGITDLGVSFATEIGEDKLPGSAPRALLYREQSVRLAHFMRSSFMDVGPELAARELLRMRDGIPRFVDWLCRDIGEPSMEAAAQGLGLVYDFLMHQVAVLRTKRLVHGSLIPSNFCIDGRLLDFTTSTAVSTLQPVMVSLGGLTSQQQHHQMLEALSDVMFYISKYDPRCAVPRASLEALTTVLKSRLNASHHEHLAHEHLFLYGFSAPEIARLSGPVKAALFDVLVKAIACGSVKGHFYFGGDEHHMLPQAGTDDLFALISHALARSCDLQLAATDGYTPRPEAFPNRIVASVVRVVQDAVSELIPPDQDRRGLGFAWLIRAMQRNADLAPLYRRNLDGEINDVCVSGGNFGALIEQMLADWRGVFAAPSDGSIELGGWLCADAQTLLADGRLQGPNDCRGALSLIQLRPSIRIRPRHRWLHEMARLNGVH